MSQSRQFYGPGAPYASFAGKEITFALARGQIEGPFNVGAQDFDEHDEEAVAGWVNKFHKKYPVVARLVADNAAAAEDLAAAAPAAAPAGTCPMGFGGGGGSCPAGFGSGGGAAAEEDLETFTLSQLKDSGRPLIAVCGDVLDASGVPQLISGGGPLEMFVGHDVSRALADGRMDPKLMDASAQGLSFDQQRRMAEEAQRLRGAMRRVGRLDGASYETIFGARPYGA